MSHSASGKARPTKRRRYLYISLGIFVALVAVVWASRRWIGDQVAAEANSRLEEAGVYLTWKEALWIPGPGVTLVNVTLYRDAARQDPAVTLQEISLIKGGGGLRDWSSGRVRAQKTRLVLLTPDTKMEVQNFSIDLFLEQGHVKLERAQGLMEGWNAIVTGEHAWTPLSQIPPEERPPPKEKGAGLKAALRFGWLAPMQRQVRVVPDDDPPVAHLDFRKASPEHEVKMNLTFDGGGFTWRGLHLTQALAKLETAADGNPWDRLEIPELEVSTGGGKANMSGYVDRVKNELIIEKLDSSLDLPALARQLAPDTASLQNLSSEGAWHLTGKGVIPIGAPMTLNWEGGVALDGELRYKLPRGTIAISHMQTTLDLKDKHARLTDVRAGLWGGKVSSNELLLDLSVPGQPSYKTNLQLSGASLQSVMASFGNGEDRPGDLDASWSGSGGFHPSQMKGSGSLGISGARFYQVPFLGPIHMLVNPLQPSFGRDTASKMDARFNISEGFLQFSKLDVSSPATKITATGSINLSNNAARFVAQARLRGLVLRLATGMVSELLTMEGEGTLPDLNWHLKNVPGSQIVTGTVDAVGGVLEETGKAAREILKLPGKLIPGRR